MSIAVALTNCRASSGVVRLPNSLSTVWWISEPVPMWPISPSARIAGLIALMASTVSFVREMFWSKGSAEKSITTESNPALAASTAFAKAAAAEFESAGFP